MSIWEKIYAVLMAPFTGVYMILDEHIENTIAKWVLYFLWCASLGWFFALGMMMTYALIYVRFHSDDSEE